MQNQFVDDENTWKYCFACGRENPIGLKLDFTYDGENVHSTFTPSRNYQGWGDMVHGGILYTLLDEVTAYAVLCNGVGSCVTAKSEVRFLHPAIVGKPIHIKAKVTKKTSRLVETTGALIGSDNTTLTEVNSLFAIRGHSNKAVLWDMDGVITDSGPFHYAAWQDVFGKRGIEFSLDEFHKLFGTRQDFIIRQVLGEDLPQKTVDLLSEQKERAYREKFYGHVKAHAGAMRLLSMLKQGSFKQALATSAPPENIDLVCNELHIDNYFDVIVAGSEVTESKPSPQIYLRAAEKLGVNPSDCTVIEDSPFGVRGAINAGMKCLAVATTHTVQELYEADKVIQSLEDIDLIGLLFRLNR
jgi:beta-phosphoglucomutase family hydrolase